MARPAKVSVIISGDRKIDAKLATLEAKVARKISRKALRKALKPILATAKSNAPSDTGELRSGLKIRAGKRSRKGIRLEIQTTGVHSHIASFIEFGTKDKPASPFMRPAYDEHKASAKKTLLDELWSGIRTSL